MLSSSGGAARAFAPPLAVSAFLSATVLLFAPAQVYYGNIMEFPMLFAEMVPSLAGAAGVVTGLLTALLLALPGGVPRRIGVAVVFALALLAWIQGNLLVWQYGVLNGQAIEWMAHRTHGVIDASVWVAGVAAAIVAARFVNRVAVFASLAFILVQTVGVSHQASRSVDRWVNHYSFDDTARFAFSPRRNVIILVLDTFQSDLFQELVDEDSGLAARFQGFMYFRNAVGGYPSTAPSIPLILSGQYYENAVPFQDFVKSAYTTASLPQALKAANYHVYYNNLYFWPSLYADETIASHTRHRELQLWGSESRRRAGALMVLGVFRSVPQSGKRLLETRITATPQMLKAGAPKSSASAQASPAVSEAASKGDRSSPGDVPFFDEMAARSSVTMTTPTFKYYHLWGLHPALTHDEHLQPQRLRFTRANAKRQATGILHLLDRFFATLRDLRIYDTSMIVIVGDHGTSFDPRLVAIDGHSRARPGTFPVATANSFALPLILVKPLDATGSLEVSDAPVSLGDIPKTVASAIGVPNDFAGVSMLDPDIPLDRQRRVLRYNPDLLRLTNDYFPPLTEYTVSGFSWLHESWRRTGREFVAGESPASGASGSQAVAQAYRFGRRLRFGLDGNAEPYLVEAWAAPEQHLTWTQGTYARVTLMTEIPQRDLVFRARVIPALPGTVRHQRAELFVNGRQVSRWTVAAAGEYSAVIPQRLVRGGEIDLVLALPDAVAPHSVSADLPDQRILALAVISAVIEEAKP
jgi:Sulfatase